MRTGKKYAVGTRHETKHNGQLKVIGYIDAKHRKVRFIDTGFVTEVHVNHIHSGNVRDPYAHSVFGVGCYGEPIEHPMRKVLYNRWRDMLRRVCVFKHGKGIAPEWRCFANFLKDAIELEGFDLLLLHAKGEQIDLDGDIISAAKGIPPMYSRDTCKWVRHVDNLHAAERARKYNIRPLGSVFESRHGQVTLIEKDSNRWLIEFSDGTQKWTWRTDVLRDTFGRPDHSEQ